MRFSAGLVPFRRLSGLEVLIAHPGGPLFARRHEGWWSVIKGEVGQGEEPFDAARREFTEETGWTVPDGPFSPLGSIVQRGGKRVTAWAVEANFDPDALDPGTFQMRWRGRVGTFPEIDRVSWESPTRAAELLNPAQGPLIERLAGIAEGA